jgi:hypothetical protein
VTPQIAAALAAARADWDGAHRIDTSRSPELVAREARDLWRRAT